MHHPILLRLVIGCSPDLREAVWLDIISRSVCFKREGFCKVFDKSQEVQVGYLGPVKEPAKELMAPSGPSRQ